MGEVDAGSGLSVPASTTLVLHGRCVTFRFADGGEETYVARDLVHALADLAGATCEPSEQALDDLAARPRPPREG